MRVLVAAMALLLVAMTGGWQAPTVLPAVAAASSSTPLTAAPLPAESLDDRFGEHTPVMVVLDTSGSMNEAVTFRSAPGTRLDVAKSAVLGAVDALPDDQTFGLLTYPGGATVDGCQPGLMRTSLGPLNRVPAMLAVRGMTADGDTPTGPALLRAAQALRDSGFTRGSIVLVSDGESNCGPPPCEIARGLAKDGYLVTVNTVGFRSHDMNAEELTCIADATGGVYIRADDHSDLVDALRSGTQATLSVTGSVEDMVVMAGPDDTRNAPMTFEVRNTGTFDAKDVRISVQAGDRQPGNMLVSRPVRFLGNIASGGSVTVHFDPRPTQAGSFRWEASVTSANALPESANGRFSVLDASDSSSLQQLLADLDRVAVVGDSYSSGHGASNYLEEPYPDCARSLSSYGHVLFALEGLDLIACSGAVTGDFRDRQSLRGSVKVEPQLAQLRAAAMSEAPPEAVLLTIGGNDAQFGALAISCVVHRQCGIRDDGRGAPREMTRDELLWLAFTTGDLVAEVLTDVDAAMNDEIALSHRDGQVAPIVLLSYPRIVPRPDVAVDRCMLGFDAEEYALLNDYLSALNAGISYVAGQLRARGRPVYVVRESVDAFQPNHTVCEGAESWVVTEAGALSVFDPGTYRLIGRKLDRTDGELLHPNMAGHQALARAVVRWSHSAPAAASAEPAHWADALIAKPPTTLQTITTPLRQISAPVLPVEPGSPFRIRSSGHRPESSVSVWMESRRVSLGSVWADESGTIDAWVEIPRTVEAGEHTVKWLGPDADGALVLRQEALSVSPRGTTGWVLLGTLGAVLSLGALVTLFRLRKSP